MNRMDIIDEIIKCEDEEKIDVISKILKIEDNSFGAMSALEAVDEVFGTNASELVFMEGSNDTCYKLDFSINGGLSEREYILLGQLIKNEGNLEKVDKDEYIICDIDTSNAIKVVNKVNSLLGLNLDITNLILTY